MCWGANTVFAKLAVGEVSPMMLTAWRWLGVVILAWLLAYRGIRSEWATLRANIWYLFAMGALGFTAFNGLFYMAAHDTTALNMGIIQGTIPVFVVLGAFLVFRERVGVIQGLGVLITLVGVALVATEGQLGRVLEMVFNRGDLMIMTACFLYAGYTIWLRNKPNVSALTWFAMLATAALIASIPAAVIEWHLGIGMYPTPKAWGVLVLIIIFPSFMAQVFFIRGVEILGPGRAGIFVNLVPILASLAAVLVLGEVFMWYHAVALLLVLGGIALAEKFAPANQSVAK